MQAGGERTGDLEIGSLARQLVDPDSGRAAFRFGRNHQTNRVMGRTDDVRVVRTDQDVRRSVGAERQVHAVDRDPPARHDPARPDRRNHVRHVQ